MHLPLTYGGDLQIVWCVNIEHYCFSRPGAEQRVVATFSCERGASWFCTKIIGSEQSSTDK